MADIVARSKSTAIQLDRRKPMAEARKLQKDMEITIKKIHDGIGDLLAFKAKVIAAATAEVITFPFAEPSSAFQPFTPEEDLLTLCMHPSAMNPQGTGSGHSNLAAGDHCCFLMLSLWIFASRFTQLVHQTQHDLMLQASDMGVH